MSCVANIWFRCHSVWVCSAHLLYTVKIIRLRLDLPFTIPFPKSHYSRSKNPNRLYLAPTLSINIMYKHYTSRCIAANGKPVSPSMYRSIFVSDFNLGFGSPRTDTCSRCDSITDVTKILLLLLSFFRLVCCQHSQRLMVQRQSVAGPDAQTQVVQRLAVHGSVSARDAQTQEVQRLAVHGSVAAKDA